MNPYEPGMLSADGFNAVVQKRIVRKRIRTVDATEYPFFYNPMWKKFSDGESGPCGTYYHKSPRFLSSYWNILDQVIVRATLMDRFVEDSLQIVETCGVRPLVTQESRIPNVSDHLPLIFRINL